MNSHLAVGEERVEQLVGERHMKASFSLRRFGVMSRMRRARS